jgi:hypothetical protein
MSSKTAAIVLAILLALTNAGWAWLTVDSAVTLDGCQRQAKSNAEAARVLINIASNPLRATTATAAVEELQQRMPDVLVKAHGDTVEISALELVFGLHGMQRVVPM